MQFKWNRVVATSRNKNPQLNMCSNRGTFLSKNHEPATTYVPRHAFAGLDRPVQGRPPEVDRGSESVSIRSAKIQIMHHRAHRYRLLKILGQL